MPKNRIPEMNTATSANMLRPYNWSIVFEPYGKDGEAYKNVRLRDSRTGRWVSRHALAIESEQVRVHSVHIARALGKSPNDESLFETPNEGTSSSDVGDAYGDKWDQIADEVTNLIVEGDATDLVPKHMVGDQIWEKMGSRVSAMAEHAGALAAAAA